ncbi:hypothetical protein E3N88_17687 [Mikania micrantha]|uniref:Uncharacterized protein n=1 Tax=Mikania micrantha TaxID=192012 RepID=A0A5N6NSQ7_9ASTR|nr:hypothetical protein E3N88_17687 [Mikania micrantha]
MSASSLSWWPESHRKTSDSIKKKRRKVKVGYPNRWTTMESEVQILVHGCGYSRLSKQLYDVGIRYKSFALKDKFTHITLLTGPSNDGLYSFTLPQVKPVYKVAFSSFCASPNT